MQGRLAHKAHGSLAFAAALLILCCRVDGVAGYSKVGVESDGELSLEELAGFGTLSGGVMEEVQRLASTGRKDAVQAIIDGTSAMAVAHRPDGEEMDDDDWDVGHARSLAVFLNGRGIDTPGPQGEPIVDDDLMVIFNAAPDTVPFDLPSALGDGWTVVVDTAGEGWLADPPAAPETLDVEGRSLVILLRSAATTTR